MDFHIYKVSSQKIDMNNKYDTIGLKTFYNNFDSFKIYI